MKDLGAAQFSDALKERNRESWGCSVEREPGVSGHGGSALVKGCRGKGLKTMSGGRLWHISSHAIRMPQIKVA